MLFRRFAVAIGLLAAGLASQVPEFAQQYRQRLGGAIDELSAVLSEFDAQAGAQSLSREQGIARLQANHETLARQRGESLALAVERRDRMVRQQTALATAGPVAQYAVLAADIDGPIARQAFGDYQPALPATTTGVVAAVLGFVAGWMLTHLAGLLVARPRRRPSPAPAV